MTIESIITIIIAIATAVITALAYPCVFIVRSVMQRIENLEQDMKIKISEQDVRVMLSDQLSPIKEDLTEIKQTQQTILNHLISKK